MHPTVACLSKASRRALTPKRGSKHFYKGTRQAQLPGGHRTGAPGEFMGRGRYRLIDEKVRVFVGPPADEINNSELKPYVHTGVRLSAEQRRDQMYLMPVLPGTKVKQWRYLREKEERAVRMGLVVSSGEKAEEIEVKEESPSQVGRSPSVMEWLKSSFASERVSR
ncbi:hypothetical protein F5I97DRAFT_1054054 [Phlebopus sp. FC_14]|nr:hypothetical protein F5I97DRAFT_1054054 [Phlebopus sp. FC_14]